MVAGAALDARRAARIIGRLHQPSDHPVPLAFPEAEYLKGLVVGIGGDIDVMENIRVGLELDRTQMSGISDGGGSIKPAAYSGLVTLKYSLPSLFK